MTLVMKKWFLFFVIWVIIIFTGIVALGTVISFVNWEIPTMDMSQWKAETRFGFMIYLVVCVAASAAICHDYLYPQFNIKEE